MLLKTCPICCIACNPEWNYKYLKICSEAFGSSLNLLEDLAFFHWKKEKRRKENEKPIINKKKDHTQRGHFEFHSAKRGIWAKICAFRGMNTSASASLKWMGYEIVLITHARKSMFLWGLFFKCSFFVFPEEYWSIFGRKSQFTPFWQHFLVFKKVNGFLKDELKDGQFGYLEV